MGNNNGASHQMNIPKISVNSLHSTSHGGSSESISDDIPITKRLAPINGIQEKQQQKLTQMDGMVKKLQEKNYELAKTLSDRTDEVQFLRHELNGRDGV